MNRSAQNDCDVSHIQSVQVLDIDTIIGRRASTENRIGIVCKKNPLSRAHWMQTYASFTEIPNMTSNRHSLRIILECRIFPSIEKGEFSIRECELINYDQRQNSRITFFVINDLIEPIGRRIWNKSTNSCQWIKRWIYANLFDHYFIFWYGNYLGFWVEAIRWWCWLLLLWRRQTIAKQTLKFITHGERTTCKMRIEIVEGQKCSKHHWRFPFVADCKDEQT